MYRLGEQYVEHKAHALYLLVYYWQKLFSCCDETKLKGTLRNGTVVAAKVLSTESKQGIHEFLTEIDTITNVRHPNLVELLGCCVQENSRILVYEYVENKSLDRILLGPNNSAADLNWELRSAICKGAASGLKFLHEELDPPIVHRDIKASNILLDSNYLPKIGDFGLAKLFPDNVTHISTRVAGTTGYLAPEYALHGQLTKKADVYSFGVLIIEIISGRSVSKGWLANMDKLLLEWGAFPDMAALRGRKTERTGGSEPQRISRGRSVTIHQSCPLLHPSISKSKAAYATSNRDALQAHPTQ
ncbi:Non-specific serine/threonine protein kinase protein [Dioscorea alata]|uniref:Non-specific serine/threonine protein kinase protein n=1 Tax=Dioscorea alata TaxID=55571 RepID=A0ACB7TZS6_DIOAL|nr:Non-specific serine/threonine protein kinase protein [Dioscorea alata]